VRAILLASLLLAGCSAPATTLAATEAPDAAQRLAPDLGPDGRIARWSLTVETWSRGVPMGTVAAAVELDDASGFLLTGSFPETPHGWQAPLSQLRIHLSCSPDALAVNITGPREAAELGGYGARTPNRAGTCGPEAPAGSRVGLTQGLGLASIPLDAVLGSSSLLPLGNWTLTAVDGEQARFTAPPTPLARSAGNWSVDARIERGRIVSLQAATSVPEGEVPARELRLSATFGYGARLPPQPLPPAQRTPWNGTR
jgi:hypothetical protein